MSIKELFDYYVSLGFTPEGAAGLLANFKAESNFNPKNLQNTSNKKLNICEQERQESLAIDIKQLDYLTHQYEQSI